ncbi:aldehyde dehydrogenase family protein [Lysinibacillus sp. 3P01SB]|uniref:aldehyde dehydrogenase family protein n=1 Tax=Lysinibacillus sp. 3P01SB TaxID=3132284 RepID=UPI0039A64344
MVQTTASRIQEIFKKQQSYQWTVRQTNAATRKDKLARLAKAISENMQEIIAATIQDVQKPSYEVFNEVGQVLGAIQHTGIHLEQWLQPQEVPAANPLAKAFVVYEPKGVVCIIGAWNFPFTLLFHPLVDAIAAGNCAIIKPSEYTPTIGALAERILRSIFNEEEIAVVQGDAATAGTLLELPFNHIFFTGSSRVGKIIMRAAANHLASVTLELGGKTPVIVDRGVDLTRTALRLAWGKMMNSGQTCIAPDYLYLHTDDVEAFTEAFSFWITASYRDENGQLLSEDRTQIINRIHYDRVRSLYTDAIEKGATVLSGGEFDDINLLVEPTLLINVTPEMKIMQEEIFAPLLPIMTYTNVQEPIIYVRNQEKPLALYIFSEDEKFVQETISSIPSGGVCVNDIMMHNTEPNLPFGGVNHSGIGSYHGIHGFKEFSHTRAVLKAAANPYEEFMMPPYKGKLEMFLQNTDQ